ncbi:MAG: UDP-N-acetyl-D-galactosamine dehydrogenase [Parvicella sp.]|jgi:UDP-N-acetyl-D-galactosamine dehydrogenase
MKNTLSDLKIAIIGLGYVGLPLAVEFSKKYSVVGFDIDRDRIDELNQGKDRTLEVDESDLKSVLNKENRGIGLFNSYDEASLIGCRYYIVTVPTPIDKNNNPDLTPLLKASEVVGRCIKKGDTVIYESTVYPGATEEECVPVLEKASGLEFNKDFYCGYSPERINPGDKEHTVSKILKVTSGSTPLAAEQINDLYKSVITAGTFLASSIKVAEAAKVIENSQRDINIAFVNELAMIFNRLGIDTTQVLEAAGTKWNFLPFRPGLVGGHCIGVDPYYLAQKSQQAGYYPQILLAGRRLNNSIGAYIGSKVIKLLMKQERIIANSKVLVLGITFKENCPDIRNSRVIDVIDELKDFGVQVAVHDPWADKAEVEREYSINLVDDSCKFEEFDALVFTVAHDQYKEFFSKNSLRSDTVVYDVKSFLPQEFVTERL